jgi:tape measure domain-containing protein
MADENISIEIADKVSPSISTKLNRIATEARSADAAVKNLQTQLAAINVGGLSQLINASANATRQLQAGAVAAQRLATEQQRTATAAAQAAAAQQRVTTATTQGQTAAQNLAAATARASTAQAQGQAAAQRLATEQQRTATAQAQAQAAADRAALAALRLQQAQNRVAQSSSNAASSIMSFVRAAAGIVGVGLSANAILGAADAYTTLQNKLQNVSDSAKQVDEITNRLFETANRTRTPVQETAQAFTRFDMALKNLGKSQDDSLRLTETVNKMLVVSGATSTEAGSALLQLSQAFNKGKLDGDEFRSVMELMPNAADAIAKKLGVTRGELLKLAPEGKITAQVMFDAFSAAATGIDAKFAKTVPTLSQAMTVLKNSATQTFGEIDKSLGITAGISKAIIFLSENMKALAVVLAVAGAALLVAFGPALLGMLAAATAAVWTFTAALAANPIGALIVGITAATAAITLFGDQIAVTSDGAVSLKDIFRTVFAYIGDAVTFVTDLFKSAWETAFAWIKEATNGWGSQFASVGDMVVSIVKAVGNFYIATWVGAFKAIKVIWEKFPEVMQYVFASVVNFGATAVETVVNAWQIGLRKIAQLGAEVAPDMAGRLNAALDAATIKLPRMEVSQGAKDAAAEVGKAFTDAFNKDYLGDAGNAFMKRARQIAAERKAAAGSATGNLRGNGPNLTPADTDSKAAKAAEKRALALSKINAELDNELSRMYMLKPEREAQARFDQIEEQLLGKKIKLAQDEAASIKAKIKAIQEAKDIQQAYDAIYEEAVGQQREYNANLTAAQKLLSQGAISQDQYNRAVTKASEAYANSQDPLRQYNKDLQQQQTLLQMLPKQREVEQQIMQIGNDLLQKGIVLTQAEIAALREKLMVIQQLNGVSQQEAALMDASVNKRQQFIDQMTAIKNLRGNPQSGFTAGDQANAVTSQLGGMGLDTSNLQVQQEANLANYQNMYDQIEVMRQQDLINENDAAALRMQIWAQQQSSQLNTASNFFGQLSQLQKSKNKELGAIGKAAAITQAVIQTYQSATGAYAAMASIPYVGPALGAAAAAAAIAAGMANVAQIRSQSTGYKTGGYTGNIGVNEVAGVVHGKEYVMDANATARIGVANLQALQNGAASVQANSASAGAAAPASAPAAASSAKAGGSVGNTTNLRIVNTLDPALVGEYLASPEGEQVFINTIRRNANSVKQAVNNG